MVLEVRVAWDEIGVGFVDNGERNGEVARIVVNLEFEGMCSTLELEVGNTSQEDVTLEDVG